jgi:hypothetical protein
LTAYDNDARDLFLSSSPADWPVDEKIHHRRSFVGSHLFFSHFPNACVLGLCAVLTTLRRLPFYVLLCAEERTRALRAMKKVCATLLVLVMGVAWAAATAPVARPQSNTLQPDQPPHIAADVAGLLAGGEVSVGGVSISAKGQKQMDSLLATAKKYNTGKSGGYCYRAVKNYLWGDVASADGYGLLGKGAHPKLMPHPVAKEPETMGATCTVCTARCNGHTALGIFSDCLHLTVCMCAVLCAVLVLCADARYFADYFNVAANREKWGLQKLDIKNPYDAPAGAIVVVGPGSPGTKHPTAGDIAVAGGGSMGPRWPSCAASQKCRYFINVRHTRTHARACPLLVRY